LGQERSDQVPLEQVANELPEQVILPSLEQDLPLDGFVEDDVSIDSVVVVLVLVVFVLVPFVLVLGCLVLVCLLLVR
jgi:hypothetical protein